MKTRLLNTIGILALALASGAAHAQTLPNTFNYQAVITFRDFGIPLHGPAGRDPEIVIKIKYFHRYFLKFSNYPMRLPDAASQLIYYTHRCGKSTITRNYILQNGDEVNTIGRGSDLGRYLNYSQG